MLTKWPCLEPFSFTPSLAEKCVRMRMRPQNNVDVAIITHCGSSQVGGGGTVGGPATAAAHRHGQRSRQPSQPPVPATASWRSWRWHRIASTSQHPIRTSQHPITDPRSPSPGSLSVGTSNRAWCTCTARVCVAG